MDSNNEDKQSAPPPSGGGGDEDKSGGGGGGGGGGGAPDKRSTSNDNSDKDKDNDNDDDTKEKAASESPKGGGAAAGSGRNVRRRPRRPGAAAAAEEEKYEDEESKVEIESLAAASGFNPTTAAMTARNTTTTTTTSGNSSTRRHHDVQPGAYAVDGPDHGSQSSLFGDSDDGGASAGSDAAAAAAAAADTCTGIMPNGNDPEEAAEAAAAAAVGGHSSRRRRSVNSVSSVQSSAGQESDNSAVAEVRAALEAEREAARAAGRGTRRPSLSLRSLRSSGMRSSLRSSVRSSSVGEDPVGAGSVGSAAGARSSATGSGSPTAGVQHHVRTRTRTGSGDLASLANHPDIEFLAEATLVVDSTVHDGEHGHGDDHGDDHGDGHGEDNNNNDDGRVDGAAVRGINSGNHIGDNVGDPPGDYMYHDEAPHHHHHRIHHIGGQGDVDDGDLSTLGPPVELLGHASSVSGGHGRRSGSGRQRQRRSARPTDPYADVPEAACTSVDEGSGSRHLADQRSRTGVGTPHGRSRAVSSGGGSGGGGSGGGGEQGTTTSPMDMEGGSSPPPPTTEPNILIAEPLMDKCLLSRRTVVISLVVGFVLMLAVAVGVAVPMSKRDDEPTAPPPPPDGGGGNDNATYPAFKFFPPNDEALTTVPEPICFSLLPVMTNVSQVCTNPAADLPKGGPMDQLIADGLLRASDPAASVDVALINGGAFRSDIFAGDLTAGFVRKVVMPFTNNRVAYLSVTPAEIYDTLNGALFDTGFVISEEQQAQFFPESPTVRLTWPYESTYPYAAGLRYDVDLNAPEGQKATNVRIHSSSSYGQKGGGEGLAEEEEAEDGWIRLDPSDDTTLIRVLSSDYLAGGGDGFFQTVPEERIEILDALGITQLFMYYCSLQSELLGPDYIDDMSTRNFVPLEGYEDDL